MSLRVCHITTVHPVKDARIFYRMCQALTAKGLSVVLIAASAAVEDPAVRMSAWNVRIAHARRRQRLRLALQAAVAEHADVYHFHDPELIPLGLALKVRRPSAAVVYDVHEDYPAMMHEKYWLPRSLRPLVALGARVANVTAGLCFDGIVTADPSVGQDFSPIAGSKTLVYYNFPPLEVFALSEPIRPTADLVYVGGMSDRAGTFVVLDALASLALQGIRVSARLAGYTDGDAGRAAIQEGIRQRGLESQVELCGRIPYLEVPTWMRSGHIGLVPLQAIPKFMKNIPSKMFEYWACGLPVIGSNLPPIRQFLREGQNGMLFCPSDPEDLARAIRYCIEHPEARKKMGCGGKDMITKEWNNDKQVEALIGFYQQISHKNGNNYGH
jgi:glycosyltransferase involved in cell wall biosynthesis